MTDTEETTGTEETEAELAARLFPRAFARARMMAKVAADQADAPTRTVRYSANPNFYR